MSIIKEKKEWVLKNKHEFHDGRSMYKQRMLIGFFWMNALSSIINRVSHGLCSLFRLLLLSLCLSKELSCLVDLLLEIVEVVEVALDLFKREID